MEKKPRILGYFEITEDGNRIHRSAERLYDGSYYPDWKNNPSRLEFFLRKHLRGKIICDCCEGELYLSGHIYEDEEQRPYRARRLHLSHTNASEQKEYCVYRKEEHSTKGEIEKDNHKFKEESKKHFYLKAIIKDAMEKMFPKSRVDLEKRIRVGNTHRQPDINVVFLDDSFLPLDTQLAIEVQVSYIMMSDVDRRMVIDSMNQRFIMWVLDCFDPNIRSLDQIYKEDIYEATGLNIFVFDDEAIRLTEQTKILHLRVWYDKYHMDGEEMAPAEKVCEIVPFTSLKFEKINDSYRVYYYPSEEERDECLKLAENYRRTREAKNKQLETNSKASEEEENDWHEAEIISQELHNEQLKREYPQFFTDNYEDEEITVSTQYQDDNDLEKLLDIFIEDETLGLDLIISEVKRLIEHKDYDNETVVQVINFLHKRPLIESNSKEIIALRSDAWFKLSANDSDKVIPTIFDYCRSHEEVSCDDCLKILEHTDFYISENLYYDCLQYINNFNYADEEITKSTRARKEKDELAFALIVYCIHEIQLKYQGDTKEACLLIARKHRFILDLMSVRIWKKHRCVACRNFPSLAGVASNVKSTYRQYSNLFLRTVERYGLAPEEYGYRHFRDLKELARSAEQNHDLDMIAQTLNLI